MLENSSNTTQNKRRLRILALIKIVVHPFIPQSSSSCQSIICPDHQVDFAVGTWKQPWLEEMHILPSYAWLSHAEIHAFRCMDARCSLCSQEHILNYSEMGFSGHLQALMRAETNQSAGICIIICMVMRKKIYSYYARQSPLASQKIWMTCLKSYVIETSFLKFPLQLADGSHFA